MNFQTSENRVIFQKTIPRIGRENRIWELDLRRIRLTENNVVGILKITFFTLKICNKTS